MLGEVNMPSHGKIKLFKSLAFSFFIFLLLLPINACLSQSSPYYYIVSYESPQWGTNAIFTKIDLETKNVLYSTSVSMPGQIMIKKPAPFTMRGDTIFFISAIDGTPAKNSEVGNQIVTNYALLNNRGDILRIGQLPNLYIYDLLYSLDDSSLIRYKLFSDRAERKMRGILKIDRNRNLNIDPRDNGYGVSIPDSIDIFTGIQRIDNNNDQFFWCLNDGAIYILSLDIYREVLIDSLNIDESLSYSHLFALSSIDSTIYAFSINYNIMGGPESLQKTSISPSYLNKYRMSDFSLLDSIQIVNTSPDSGYIMSEYGSADKMEPYLVYFFFNGEDYRYFSPAMLFIFDTRTNEATWLRVGWR
jgi:hypothetical protein